MHCPNQVLTPLFSLRMKTPRMSHDVPGYDMHMSRTFPYYWFLLLSELHRRASARQQTKRLVVRRLDGHGRPSGHLWRRWRRISKCRRHRWFPWSRRSSSGCSSHTGISTESHNKCPGPDCALRLQQTQQKEPNIDCNRPRCQPSMSPTLQSLPHSTPWLRAWSKQTHHWGKAFSTSGQGAETFRMRRCSEKNM